MKNGEPSVGPIILAGFGFLFGFVVTAAFIRMVNGAQEVRVTTWFGEDRELRRDPEFAPRPRGGASARPLTKR